MNTYRTETDEFGSEVCYYEAESIDAAMQQYIDDVCAAFPEAADMFASVRIMGGVVVSSYDDQAFEPGTVFLSEMNERR